MSSPAPPPEPPQVRRYGLGPVLASWAGPGDDGDTYEVQLRRAAHTRQLWLLCDGARAGTATPLNRPAIAGRIAGLVVVGGEAQQGAELVEVDRASRTERVALSGTEREWLVVSADTADEERVAVRQFGPDGTQLIQQVLDLPVSGAGDRGPRWWRRPFALARIPAGRTRYGRLDG